MNSPGVATELCQNKTDKKLSYYSHNEVERKNSEDQ